MSGPARFYDDLSEYYDLIYSDWETSMLRHGRSISTLLHRAFPNRLPSSIRILDVAAGVGTQAIAPSDSGSIGAGSMSITI